MFLYPRHRFSSSTALFVFLLMLLPSIAGADWERLPDPPIQMPDYTLFHEDGVWTFNMLEGPSPLLGCGPFLVADDSGRLYIGQASALPYYNVWVRYDVDGESYTNLRSPFSLYAPWDNLSYCIYNTASGAYADNRILVGLSDDGDSLALYDVAADRWSWSAYPAATPIFSTVWSDPAREVFFWYDGGDVGRYDFETGPGGIRTGELADAYVTQTNGAVVNNRAYIAGGFFIGYYKSSPLAGSYGFGESTDECAIYNFVDEREEPMRAAPQPATYVGTGAAYPYIHFVGSRWREHFVGYWGFSLPNDKYVSDADHYHHRYNPETDSWDEPADDLPPNCLPWSVSQQGAYLYGLFSCDDPNPNAILLYRSHIGDGTWPPTTTTTSTTNATTTTGWPGDDDSADDDATDDDQSDDDLSDDDLTDDDAIDDDTADDDTSDDDFTPPDADDDDDDDDDICGCG